MPPKIDAPRAAAPSTPASEPVRRKNSRARRSGRFGSRARSLLRRDARRRSRSCAARRTPDPAAASAVAAFGIAEQAGDDRREIRRPESADSRARRPRPGGLGRRRYRSRPARRRRQGSRRPPPKTRRWWSGGVARPRRRGRATTRSRVAPTAPVTVTRSRDAERGGERRQLLRDPHRRTGRRTRAGHRDDERARPATSRARSAYLLDCVDDTEARNERLPSVRPASRRQRDRGSRTARRRCGRCPRPARRDAPDRPRTPTSRRSDRRVPPPRRP